MITRFPLFAAALAAGTSFWLGDLLVAPGPLHIVWKGAGVGLLALWAASVARGRDGCLLAAVMACGAAGDVLLEMAGLTVGAVAFLVGHVIAVGLYLGNRRADAGAGARLVASVLLVASPLVAWLLTRNAGVAFYASVLGAMAGSAWISRYPRGLVGLGAMLFILSDWLIFARAGPLADGALPGLAIWPTYFAGQALIAWGVATSPPTGGAT